MSRGERPRTDLSSGSREDPARRRPGFRSPACRTVRPCAPVVEAPQSVVLGVAAPADGRGSLWRSPQLRPFRGLLPVSTRGLVEMIESRVGNRARGQGHRQRRTTQTTQGGFSWSFCGSAGWAGLSGLFFCLS